MNKKALIKYVGIVGALTIVISGAVLISSYAGADNLDGNIIITDSSLEKYDLCEHDETYQEPELKIGKYYYNGDTSAKYIEITGDGKLYLKGGTTEDFVRDFLVEVDEAKKEDAPEELKQIFMEEMEFHSKPIEYKVFTEHRLHDKIYVYKKWSEYKEKNGDIGYTGVGFVLEDENTLRLNKFTRYILVE